MKDVVKKSLIYIIDSDNDSIFMFTQKSSFGQDCFLDRTQPPNDLDPLATKGLTYMIILYIGQTGLVKQVFSFHEWWNCVAS